MIFDNTEHYFVTDIKFAKSNLDLYVPEDMIETYTDEELDTAIRSYMFYHCEPTFKHTRIETDYQFKIKPEYIEQSFNADDGDAIHERTKSQTGILLTDVNVRVRNNFVVPFDYNCLKYQSEMSNDEIIQQEIFEHMMWSLPVFIYRQSKKDFL
jgi:hypothetical protein